METRAATLSNNTGKAFFVLFWNPIPLLQKPVSQVEENNLSRMLLTLGNRTALIMGGGGGYPVPGSLHGESRPPGTIWASHWPLAHPFLNALVTYLIPEVWKQKLGLGTQPLPTSSPWVPSYSLEAHKEVFLKCWLYGSRPPCQGASVVQCGLGAAGQTFLL